MQETKAKRFPIQKGGSVPWKRAEQAYIAYSSFFGKQQTLERLSERGGFGIGEFCCLYSGKNPFRLQQETIEKFIAIVAMELKHEWILM